MQDAKEEVRARLNIEDVIGEYVQLKRAGRNMKGLSPFTDERTPSFMVSPEKQIWHDFSSGKGGDVFSFVMLVEGMDFRQALEHLARKAGVDLSLFSRGDGRTAKRRARAAEALELAAKFFQQSLLRTPKALEYVVKKRGLTRQTIQDFMVGFAPDDGSSLVTALTKRGFSKQELADAGLTNRFGGDLYRGRMVVALMDATGRVVGFTGRIIHDEANAPKYLNTPQTLLFDKSRHIFGLSQAKEAIRKSDEVVIVEGNLDVVSSHQAGVRQVVATAGTAITEQHLKALSRLASRIKLAFDGDRAGLNATERAIKLSQTIGVELEVVSLPEGSKDPDELIKLHGVKQWELAITNAVPAVAWVIQQYSQRENVRIAEGKRRFSTASLNLIRSLHDPVEQEHYLQMVAEKTGASIEALTAKMSGITTNKTVLRHPKVKKTAPQKPSDETLDMLLGLAVQEPGVRRWLASVPEEITDNVNTRELLKYLTQNPNAALDPMPETLKNIEEYVKIVQLKFDTRYADWDKDDLPGEMARLVKHVISKHRENKIQQLMSNLRDAETANNESLAHDLRHQLNALIKEKA
ncbi:DNA primase [Candidatus Nanosynbacter sp. BB002]|uniref:DNA primase n=1 Tax=Candidatus Nanosynbacter sp. BB002 TaxID=3393757 RepID=UPI0030D3D49A